MLRAPRFTDRLIELWPLWLALSGGAVACVKFYFTVADISQDQQTWKASSEQRRESTHRELDEIRIRITKIEDDISWMKHKED